MCGVIYFIADFIAQPFFGWFALGVTVSLELMFDTPPEQLWQAVLRRKGGWRNKLRAQMPEDLSWN
jgi:hypothetical protein